MTGKSTSAIPVLTDAVDARAKDDHDGIMSAEDAPASVAGERDALIAELQTHIAAGAFALTDEIIRSAFAEMEASIYERIAGRLRRELPEMIDRLLREHLDEDADY
jgi:hypothetical protein